MCQKNALLFNSNKISFTKANNYLIVNMNLNGEIRVNAIISQMSWFNWIGDDLNNFYTSWGRYSVDDTLHTPFA